MAPTTRDRDRLGRRAEARPTGSGADNCIRRATSKKSPLFARLGPFPAEKIETWAGAGSGTATRTGAGIGCSTAGSASVSAPGGGRSASSRRGIGAGTEDGCVMDAADGRGIGIEGRASGRGTTIVMPSGVPISLLDRCGSCCWLAGRGAGRSLSVHWRPSQKRSEWGTSGSTRQPGKRSVGGNTPWSLGDAPGVRYFRRPGNHTSRVARSTPDALRRTAIPASTQLTAASTHSADPNPERSATKPTAKGPDSPPISPAVK